MSIHSETVLHEPGETARAQDDGLVVLIDPAAPRWIATDERGEEIVSLHDGIRSVGAVVREYATRRDLPRAVAR